jgi:hypothetical protein
LPDVDPVAILRETLELHDFAIAELRAAAKTADNTSAKVGACRALTAAATERLDLLGHAGLVYVEPVAWAAEIEVRRVVDALDSLGIDRAELIHTLENGPGEPLAIRALTPAEAPTVVSR